ncbi:MAG: Gfo/Idh/MocA family oxidoreductase [Actinomycetota bacterium]|nr:Gfo/Idh/MocA family oxidoreductase [Actinomycetota bacterium]
MKIAVVGLGYWGPQLVRNLTHLEQCSRLVACDLDETRVKAICRQYPGVAGATDYEELLRDPELKGVLLATPVRTHSAMAAQALEAGVNVLVEKPLATSFDDAAWLIASAEEKGLLVMAGHTFLHSPAVQAVEELVRRGDVGKPLYAQSSRVNLGIHQSDVSVIWDLAPHDLSILIYWLKERPVSVSATGKSVHGVGPADVAFVDLQFPSGCIANIHLSWLAPTKMRRTTLVGDKRMVVYEDTNAEEPVKLYDKGVNLPDPEDFGQYKTSYRAGDVISPRVDSWEPLRAELAEFLGRVARGETPNGRENTALSVVATIEAAEQSLATNGAVVQVRN